MQPIGLWLLRSRLNAAVVAFALSLLQYFHIPAVGMLASVLIALVTLRKGAKDGLFVALWAILPAVALLMLGNRFTFFDVLLFHVLLVYCLAVILRTTQSWAITLESGAAIAAVFMFLMLVFVPEIHDFLSAMITTIIQKLTSLKKMDFDKDEINTLANSAIYFSAGIFASSFVLSNILNLVVARWWQSSLFNPGGFGKEFLQIRISRITTIVFTLCLLLSVLGLNYAGMFVPILLVPFTISGISVAHGLLIRHEQKYLLLIVFYASLLLFALSMIFILALLGYVNSWYNLRSKSQSAS